jgi:hypothetical protein
MEAELNAELQKACSNYRYRLKLAVYTAGVEKEGDHFLFLGNITILPLLL